MPMATSSSFEVSARRESETGILSLRGRVIGERSVQLREAIEAFLREDGIRHVVLNLRGVEFLDSAGLGMLVALHRRAQEEDRRLVLAELPGPLSRLLRVTKLDQILEIFPDERTACAALSGAEASPQAAERGKDG